MTVRTAVPRYRGHAGPALFSQGFRPFFLFAGLWAVATVPLWLMVFHHGLVIPTAFDPMAWHAHEMIFGFAVAVVAGFLLTAIPNWTGRLPLQGLPLAGLVAVWLAGRLAVGFSAIVGVWPAAAVDTAFLVLLLGFALREIFAGRNWRNLPLTGALLLFIASNGLIHLQAAGVVDSVQAGERLGIATLAMLIGLIGGRIIPSFTRNWLAKRGAAALPIYLAIAAAAAARVAAALLPDAYIPLLAASGLLWTLAFGLFVLRYGALHLSPRAATAH